MVPSPAQRIVERVSTDEEANMSANAAQPTSVRAVCARLGVPAADWNLMAQWAAELGEHRSHDALDYYVDLMIADRCSCATDDLLSELISTGVAGLDLTAEEIRLAVAAMLALAFKVESATRRT
jgi:cytochrome P450